jgi:hypothetical protein
MVDGAGNVDWIASFPDQIVPTAPLKSLAARR